MEYYCKTSHAVYDIRFHIVWITKYRKPAFHGEVAIHQRDLIRETFSSHSAAFRMSFE